MAWCCCRRCCCVCWLIPMKMRVPTEVEEPPSLVATEEPPCDSQTSPNVHCRLLMSVREPPPMPVDCLQMRWTSRKVKKHPHLVWRRKSALIPCTTVCAVVRPESSSLAIAAAVKVTLLLVCSGVWSVEPKPRSHMVLILKVDSVTW